MESMRRCNICKIDVRSAAFAKHLASKKHLEKLKPEGLVTSEWLSLEPIENKPRKMYNPKPLRKIAPKNNKKDDKQLIKELPESMLNLYNSTDSVLQEELKYYIG